MTDPRSHPGPARLQRYLLGELSGERRLDVDRHVAECARCRARVEQEQQLDEWLLASLPATPAADDTAQAFKTLWERVDAGEVASSGSVAEAGTSAQLDSSPRAVSQVIQASSLAEDSASPPSTVESGTAGEGSSAKARVERRLLAMPLRFLTGLAAMVGIVAWLASLWDLDLGTSPQGELGGTPGAAVVDESPERELSPHAPWGLDQLEPGASATAGERTVLPQVDEGLWEPVDPVRLENARGTVRQALLAAHQEFPHGQEGFRMACEHALAGLRAQGWPVSALVRGLALAVPDTAAADAEVADSQESRVAALRHAATSAAGYSVLARALALEAHVDDALAVLESAGLGPQLGTSGALVHELEKRVLPGALWDWVTQTEGDDTRLAIQAIPVANNSAWNTRRANALALLRQAEGSRVERSWARLADEMLSGLERLKTARAAEPLLRELASLWPAERALGVLQQLSQDAPQAGEWRETLCRSLFLEHADRLDDATVRRVDNLLSEGRSVSTLLEWCVAADVRGIVPSLVRSLENERQDLDWTPGLESPGLGARNAQSALVALVAIGGPEAAAALHGLWRDTPSHSRSTVFLEALASVLKASPPLASQFGGALVYRDSELVVELAEALSDSARKGLLVGALRGFDEMPMDSAANDGAPRSVGWHETQRAASRSGLLVSLGRMGTVAEGQQLLAWIETQPADEPLLPLAWAAAGHIAPTEAFAAWNAHGGDSRVLSEVVEDASPQLAAAAVPARRILAPLSAAIARVDTGSERKPTPSRSSAPRYSRPRFSSEELP